ncbi:DUF4179 domain-containing protein [Lysinibacillus macroides]|uniref:DUF5643 domain-containing protein n=1 Tax=Lysinibacillus macroides TaxID=33935 RepID=A0A0N1J0B5_9BACI|nr:DUF4179 domain-containing protein [Lysinibacillus macroides]KOY83504.1 hypothetical protein ADM90_09660 [Lysinibacillus macroides]QPR69374.1 DUF4179 domain-containing protein [Lysinibacillus macroides]
MGMYKDFNDITIDTTEFEEQPLTKLEQKRLKRRIVKQLPRKRRRIGYRLGTVAILALSIVIFQHQSIANMPFVASLLEEWRQDKAVDWGDYKNVVGQTVTTQFGALTVNEVLLDYDKILVSATLQPADKQAFSYRHQLLPTISIDGQPIDDVGYSAQSIEQNDAMFTIYSEIKLPQPVDAAQVSIQLSYNRMLLPNGTQPFGQLLEEPWTFNVVATQAAVQQQTKEYPIQQPITLADGQSLTVERIVTTPISTTIYYSNASQKPDFALFDKNGERYMWDSATHEDDGSGILHFPGAFFSKQALYIGTKKSEQLVVQP